MQVSPHLFFGVKLDVCSVTLSTPDIACLPATWHKSLLKITTYLFSFHLPLLPGAGIAHILGHPSSVDQHSLARVEGKG